MSHKDSKNILITGGSGFIGSHLANQLIALGHKVSVLDRTPKPMVGVKLFQGDITNAVDVAKAMKGMDLVYHLAGVLGTEELNTQSVFATQINVIGTLNILDAAVANKTKVLLVSKPNVWLNTYSITKETSEKFSQLYQKEFGLKVVTVKWFSVYGPGQKHYGVQKAVPTFIVKALKNEPLPVFDNGQQEADFIYTSDTIRATILVAEDPKLEGQTVEIGTGQGTSVNDLAKLIIKLSGSKSEIEYLPMRGGEDPETKVVANVKLLKSLGFKPEVNLEEGLIETITFYRDLLKLEAD